MKAWGHFCTINRHKMLVMKGCFEVGLIKQGLLHDLSKYSPTEFLVGCKYYQGNIYKDDFWDVWENCFESYRNREWMRKQEPCNNCKLFRYCEGGGMHLRREDGSLMLCHHNKLQEASAKAAQR